MLHWACGELGPHPSPGWLAGPAARRPAHRPCLSNNNTLPKWGHVQVLMHGTFWLKEWEGCFLGEE